MAEPFATFQDLSAALTGFEKSELFPALDPTQIGRAYFDEIQARGEQALLERLLAAYAAAPDADAFLTEQLALGAPTEYGGLLRKIIQLWYFGIWMLDGSPSNVQSDPSTKTNVIELPRGDYEVVSATAYTMGLFWQAAHCHPMGYSQFHTGYWAELPPGAQS